jgi:hypothetical protein
MSPRTLLAALALLAACDSAPRGDASAPGRVDPPGDSAAAQDSVSVALVDSVAAVQEMDPVMLYRVEVRSGASVDTIPGVLVDTLPRVMGGAVVGLAADSVEGAPNAAFRYDAATRRVQLVRLTGVAAVWLGRPVLSPDGRYVAHAAVVGDGTAHAEVRSLPGGEVVARGPSAALPEAESLENLARWPAPDAFEVYLQLAEGSGDGESGAWQRVRGRVPSGEVRVDTVTSLPAAR